MIEYRLDVSDLAATRFAASPLHETVTSLWAWRPGAAERPHLAWLRRHQPALAGLDLRLLDAMVAPHGWLPDFLTPRPDTFLPDIADELAVLRATPAERVRADIVAATRGEPLNALLADALGDPPALAEAAAASLEAYWHAVIAPLWPRMRAILEGDVVYRSLQLARGGAEALFADLEPRVRWEGGVLYVDAKPGVHEVVDVAGRGLPLMPTIFATNAVTLVSHDQPPVIAYPARGRAALWLDDLPAPPPALEALLGKPRATLLALLDRPSSTTELAARLDVTPSAVNQHLQALARAGLLGRVRSGRTVLYARTPNADAWLGDLA
jgi:DNA-binding transcriptional ArsR family regulator